MVLLKIQAGSWEAGPRPGAVEDSNGVEIVTFPRNSLTSSLFSVCGKKELIMHRQTHDASIDQRSLKNVG